MFAVIETGGKQYKVAKNDVFSVEKMKAKEGGEVKIAKVLLAKDGNSVHVGNPYLKGSQVICEVIRQAREPKVIAYKYKRRKSEKKKIGYRRDVTVLKVKEIDIAKG
ncbi:MAG: 50S ribosomal protein L21 [Candidatus Omnitrophica bacterium]|nr:50S ribosomal protein L21 [Candidatus Omnitrophota bacterium]